MDNKQKGEYMCTYPQCLLEYVEINCQKYLNEFHKHDQPNCDHIILLSEIEKKSKENIKIAIERLKSFFQSNQNENEIVQLKDKIKKVIELISANIQEILNKINDIIIGRLENIENALKKSEEELNNLQMVNIDFQNKEQNRILGFLAISTQENILPNLDILNVKVDDIKYLLIDIESTITNLNQSVKIENKNQSFEIQLYTPQIQGKYEKCPTHKQCLIEYICITCNDRVLGCKLCMKSTHLNHNVIEQEKHKKDLAANQSSLATIRKNQKTIEKVWKVFIEKNTSYFKQELTATIDLQLESSFKAIENRQYDSIYCNDTYSTFQETSLESQNQIKAEIRSLLSEIKQKINISNKTIETERKSIRMMVEPVKSQFFQEQDFNEALKIKGDYQFIITDNQNIELFKFEVSKADIKVTIGESIILGSKDNKNCIKFEQARQLYRLDEVKIDGKIKIKKYSQQINDNIEYKWKWIIFTNLE